MLRNKVVRMPPCLEKANVQAAAARVVLVIAIAEPMRTLPVLLLTERVWMTERRGVHTMTTSKIPAKVVYEGFLRTMPDHMSGAELADGSRETPSTTRPSIG